MKQLILSFLCVLSCTVICEAQIQAPSIQWEVSIGTDSTDGTINAMVDQHGHIYVLGHSKHPGINGDKSYSIGADDYWLIKLDANGHKLWDTVYGGRLSEVPNYAFEYDGEIIISGVTTSKDGDISDTIGKGGIGDIWVIKLDANGKKIWDKRYGSSAHADDGMVIKVQNGYLLAGLVPIADGDRTIPVTYGNWIWVAKLDNNGNKQWEKSFGAGQLYDTKLMEIVATQDGGSMLVSSTNGGIGGDKTDTSRGDYDLWLIKLDANGNTQWDRTLGNPNNDRRGYSYEYRMLVQCPDGTYILANNSLGGNGGDKTSGYIDGFDIWVVKLDANGQKLWDKTIGTNQPDAMNNIAATADNGVLLSCMSKGPANHHKSEDSKGETDIWIVRMDSNGNILWDKTIGGDKDDGGSSIINLGNNGIVLAGSSYSGISGDKSSASKGQSDIWVIKLGPEQTNSIAEAANYPQMGNAYPNPVRSLLQFTHKADVQIMSLDGKTVLSANVVDHVSVEHLSTGVYILQYKKPSSHIWQSVQMVKE